MATVVIKSTITLTLSEAEAKYLREVLQNARHDNESSSDTAMRFSIFHALPVRR